MNEPVIETSRQIVYEFVRATSLEGWWLWALLVAGLAALLFACVRLYRRDVEELSQPVRWTLITLRLTAVVALVFFFFDLQRRTQRLINRPSEVVVLVDTSQSMALPAGTSTDAVSRAQRARSILADSDVLDEFGQEHRVSVYAFDSESEPRLLESRGLMAAGRADAASPEPADPVAGAMAGPASPLALFGATCITLAILLSIISLAIGAFGRGTSIGWLLFATAASWIVGIICLGGVYSVKADQPILAILGMSRGDVQPQSAPQSEEDLDETIIRVNDWGDRIAAAGAQSRIGDALRSALSSHDPATLAGIVLLTDGQNNGGTDSTTAIAQARRNEVAVYPVGLGSSDAPTNLRVVDLDVPKRVYPGDKFAVTAVLQASGPEPQSVEVQLLDGLDQQDSSADDDGDPAAVSGEVIDSQKVDVANDGTLSGIRFELEPETVGRRRLAVRVVAPPGDQNERDDVRRARYEVVARKLRVMVVAGGPTREYRFVRNLLFRDESVELDVWLQTGQPGMSQDADRLLTSFPSTAEELFQYDAVVAFDPDWTALNGAQLDLLDRWLAQQAGGLIIVAGPVYHPRWTRLRTDPRVSRIAGFFPINLATRGPLLDGGRQGGEHAWPIEFTAEARRAEFLWIAENPQESFEAWNEFGGVYDFVGVKSAKPGAKVYAYFSDPTTEVGGSKPIYLASQFYGAGRVYFQGSGEMWRLRGESDAYFNSYYTKLVRWVSEGRLLRDSNRGLLLVDNSRAMVGDTITVRAVLTDEQFEPLAVPEVPAKLLSPSGRIHDIALLPLKGEPRPGTYGGRFIVREAGSYELRLTLGDALDEQVLRQSVQVRLPTIELERPRRNDEELQQLALMTSGEYLPVDEDVTDAEVAAKLTALIEPQPQTTILPGTPDREFNERRNAVLMWLIASVLTFEWITRRLHRLA